MRLKARSSLSLPQSQRSGRALSWVLSVLMVFTMMPGSALIAYADPEPAGPEITAQTEQIDVEYQAAVAEADRTLSVTATGNGNLTYKWWGCDDYFSEFYEITGATDSTYVLDENFTSELGTTWYYCEISDDEGSIYSTVINVYVRKTVGIQWSDDTEFEYNGDEQAPEAWATGLLPGDECEVYVDGETDAGENCVATASGLSSWKYKLPADNLTCSFSIRPLEVTLDWDDTEELPYNGQLQPAVEVTNLKGHDDCTVTLDGQSVNPTGGATLTATVTGLTGSKAGNYTLTQSGDPITIDYSIVNRPVTITAKNQVVEQGNTIADNPGAVAGMGLADGDRITEADVRAGDNGRITVSSAVIRNSANEDVTGFYDVEYEPGRLTIVSANPEHELCGLVEIPGNPYPGTPVADATVILERGNVVYGVTTTDAEGNYKFTSVDPGWYNVVVTKGNITVTRCIRHSYEGVASIYVSSMLEAGQRGILDTSAAGDTAFILDGLTQCAQYFLQSDPGSVRFTVTSEENADTLSWKKRTEFNEGLTEISSLPEADGMELQFFDMSLTMTASGVTTDLGNRGCLLTIIIPYDMSRKNIAVFRYHDGIAELMPRFTSLYGAEGYQYSDEYLIIQTAGFSTYAIGYEPERKTEPDGGGGGRTSGGNDRGLSAVTEPEPAPVETPVTPDPAQPGAPQNPASVFTDLKPGAYYTEAMNWAATHGIVKGRSATLFAPDDSCTRGELVTFIWRAAGSPEPGSTDQRFKDVGPADFFSKAANWAAEKGVTNGTGDGAFSPLEIVKRKQAVTFLYRAMNQAGEIMAAEVRNHDDGSIFSDVRDGEYYSEPVNWALEKGITTGTAPGIFSPETDCTRAQIVTFLYRAYN